MVLVSPVLVSAEIVLIQLWWDLLDPYVKQTQNLTHTSPHFSPSPFLLPLFTFLRTFCQIQFSCVYLLFTVCWLHLC